jgi:hypothetical protein
MSRQQPAVGDQLTLDGLVAKGEETKELCSGRSRWSWLLRRVFRAELSTCCRCGGAMRWVEVATERDAIARLLAKHGLAPQPPPATRALAPLGQLVLPFSR